MEVAILAVVLVLVIFGAMKLYGRSQKKLGGAEAVSRGRKVNVEVTKEMAKRAANVPDTADALERLMRRRQRRMSDDARTADSDGSGDSGDAGDSGE